MNILEYRRSKGDLSGFCAMQKFDNIKKCVGSVINLKDDDRVTRLIKFDKYHEIQIRNKK